MSFDRPMTSAEEKLFTEIKQMQNRAQLRDTLTKFRAALSAGQYNLALAIAMCGLALARILHNKPQSEPTLFSDPDVGYRPGKYFKNKSARDIWLKTQEFKSNLMEYAFQDDDDFSTPIEWDLACVETADLAEGEALVMRANARPQPSRMSGVHEAPVLDIPAIEAYSQTLFNLSDTVAAAAPPEGDVPMTLDTDLRAPFQPSELPFRKAKYTHSKPSSPMQLDFDFFSLAISQAAQHRRTPKFKRRPAALNLSTLGAVPVSTRRQPCVQLRKQRALKRKLITSDMMIPGARNATSMAPPLAKKLKVRGEAPPRAKKTRPDSLRPDCGLEISAATFPMTYGAKGPVAAVKRLG